MMQLSTWFPGPLDSWLCYSPGKWFGNCGEVGGEMGWRLPLSQPQLTLWFCPTKPRQYNYLANLTLHGEALNSVFHPKASLQCWRMSVKFQGVEIAYVTHPWIQLGQRQIIQTSRRVWEGMSSRDKCPNDMLVGFLANLLFGFPWLEMRMTKSVNIFQHKCSPHRLLKCSHHLCVGVWQVPFPANRPGTCPLGWMQR